MSKSMTSKPMILAPRMLALVPLAILAGCVSLGAEPPPSLPGGQGGKRGCGRHDPLGAV